jgi:5-carboxymethyl-2-hydroxymuconate isomerase
MFVEPRVKRRMRLSRPAHHQENHGAMPHLTLEYSANLNAFDTEATLRALNEALAASGHFNELDIKSRCIRRDAFLVGTSREPRAFVHATLAILSGRAPDMRRALSEQVLSVLKACCGAPSGVHLQLSVQVVEIERESYAKAVIEPPAV